MAFVAPQLHREAEFSRRENAKASRIRLQSLCQFFGIIALLPALLKRFKIRALYVKSMHQVCGELRYDALPRFERGCVNIQPIADMEGATVLRVGVSWLLLSYQESAVTLCTPEAYWSLLCQTNQ
jgi:hypothetical protein